MIGQGIIKQQKYGVPKNNIQSRVNGCRPTEFRQLVNMTKKNIPKFIKNEDRIGYVKWQFGVGPMPKSHRDFNEALFKVNPREAYKQMPCALDSYNVTDDAIHEGGLTLAI